MKLVHCMRSPYTHYIGRPHPRVPEEKWGVLGNPFIVHTPTQREMVLLYYDRYARAKGEVLDAIYALPEDAVLGCWCWPKPCHGEIIMEIWRELHT